MSGDNPYANCVTSGDTIALRAKTSEEMAARMMDIDLRPFEDALAEKHRQLDSTAA